MIAEPGLGGRAAAERQGFDPDHPHPPMQREAEHITHAHGGVRPVHGSAADTDVTGFGHLLREGARLREPGEPKEFVQAERVAQPVIPNLVRDKTSARNEQARSLSAPAETSSE